MAAGVGVQRLLAGGEGVEKREARVARQRGRPHVKGKLREYISL
jgi:hypothetical protein